MIDNWTLEREDMYNKTSEREIKRNSHEVEFTIVCIYLTFVLKM